MEYIKFYLEKFWFMFYFAYYRMWGSVWDELKMTKKELDAAKANFDEINKRLIKAINDDRGI